MGASAWPGIRNADRAAYGNALIRTAIAQAVGQMPGDVAVKQQVVSGRPAAELASLAWGGDLLVLGSRRRMAAKVRVRRDVRRCVSGSSGGAGGAGS